MSRKCFIVCPIGVEGSEVRSRSDTVFDYFLKPICENMGYEIIRCDKITSDEKIDSEIINYLNTADLVIADLTNLNPNVFYEIGYRKAKGLPCIHIALEGTDLPFDVTTVRTQFYSITDIPKSEKFKDNLKSVISNIESRISDTENKTEVVVVDTTTSMEQKLLDRLYNIEDSLQSFYDMIESGFIDIDRHIDECRNAGSPKDSYEQMIMEAFIKEAMKNPINAKRLISQFQDLNGKPNI